MVFFSTIFGLQTEKPCQLRKFDAGYVCVCSDDYCDTLYLPELKKTDEYLLVTTTQLGQRFNLSFGEFHTNYDDNQPTNLNEIFVEIHQNIAHQEIIGFGASFSGAVSYILNKLSANLRECIYKSYYTNDVGIGYTLLRLPIGGCDFDLEPWTYNEFPENDLNLTNFTTLHPNDILRTNLIKQLKNVSQNVEIKIIGVAWSPPRWMKQSGKWPGTNDNQLKIEYYQTFADYHVKWLDLMHAVDIPITAISTGNEPYFAQFTPFIGLSWQASEQAKWIAKHLGPAVRQSKHSSVQIHAFDDNRDVILAWFDEINSSNEHENAMEYISAIGVHGYFDKETSPTILDRVKSKYADKSILYTEMCFGVTGPLSTTGPTLGSWSHFEELTDMLMETLMHNVNGFMDWNMILDSRGGPNYIHNVVDAMIIANENFTEIYKQPIFYAASHFTKFILAGSRRIETTVSGNDVGFLRSLAFLRPDNKVVAIFYNRHDKNIIELRINDKSKGKANIQLKPKSLNSLLYSI